MCLSRLWTSVWLDGSLPVIDSLLDSLNQQLTHLTDLKPACRQVRLFAGLPICLSVSHLSVSLTAHLSFCLQSLLYVLHQDVVLQYVKRMMKTRTKSREQQVGGARRMTEDAQKINDFFNEGVRHVHAQGQGRCGSDQEIWELLVSHYDFQHVTGKM